MRKDCGPGRGRRSIRASASTRRFKTPDGFIRNHRAHFRAPASATLDSTNVVAADGPELLSLTRERRNAEKKKGTRRNGEITEYTLDAAPLRGEAETVNRGERR